MNILGISAYYHDAAACLVRDGEIVAAAQEERFSRKRHDASFPRGAVRYCLEMANDAPIDRVVFYDKPITKLNRILQTYLRIAPRGVASYLSALPLWMSQKMWTRLELERELESLGAPAHSISFTAHHESHAASAFYPSPFSRAAILTMDGVGEWATTTIALGKGARIEPLAQLSFPHSLGLLYSAFTYFTGFKVNSGEYKLMGLAPYGEPRYVKTIYEHLVDLRSDGSLRLDLDYFDYLGGFTMTNRKFARLFDGPPRSPEARITRREMDLAASIQAVTEEVVLRSARHALALTGARDLCLAGGVALNCVANGRLVRERVADRVWVQPAAGDAGSALGAALYGWHVLEQNPRHARPNDSMHGAYLGPSYSNHEIEAFLSQHKYPYVRVDGDAARAEVIATHIAADKVVGLFMGRMEFGPRALGHRSILGNPGSATMQAQMNLRIKFRESFRPFAPSVLAEDVNELFELDAESPYMLLVAAVREALRLPVEDRGDEEDLLKRVNLPRSKLPAITHVDHSARLQTVTAERNPGYYEILRAVKARLGYGVVINTSFNLRGEPIVCTPAEAYRCFMRSAIDVLVLEHCVLERTDQPAWVEDEQWRARYELD